ncbi:MAG: hypothetical protein L0H59_12340 [Tomitella sp.]|nr:hypothetical protein [Tomitella sp.]
MTEPWIAAGPLVRADSPCRKPLTAYSLVGIVYDQPLSDEHIDPLVLRVRYAIRGCLPQLPSPTHGPGITIDGDCLLAYAPLAAHKPTGDLPAALDRLTGVLTGRRTALLPDLPTGSPQPLGLYLGTT